MTVSTVRCEQFYCHVGYCVSAYIPFAKSPLGIVLFLFDVAPQRQNAASVLKRGLDAPSPDSLGIASRLMKLVPKLAGISYLSNKYGKEEIQNGPIFSI